MNEQTATAPATDETYDWDGAFQRLDEAMDREYPKAWLPTEPGDEIRGKVIEIQPAVHTAHGPKPVVTIQGPNGGTRSIWLVHTALRSAFIRANVQLGEIVGIRYLGKVASKTPGNSPYADYKVAVDRLGGKTKVNWMAIARDQGDAIDVPEIAEPDVPAAAVDDDIPF